MVHLWEHTPSLFFFILSHASPGFVLSDHASDTNCSDGFGLPTTGKSVHQRCLDSMRFDAAAYPEARGNSKWPVSMQPCGKSVLQKLVLTYVDVEKSAAAAEQRMHKEGRAGH